MLDLHYLEMPRRKATPVSVESIEDAEKKLSIFKFKKWQNFEISMTKMANFILNKNG